MSAAVTDVSLGVTDSLAFDVNCVSSVTDLVSAAASESAAAASVSTD